MNSRFVASITHLEVCVEELTPKAKAHLQLDECWKLNEAIKHHPCQYMGWGLGQVQWIQCVLSHGEPCCKFYLDMLRFELMAQDANQEASRSLNENWEVEVFKRASLDDFFKRHALRIVRGLPESCKAFSRVFLAGQVGTDHITTHSIVLMRAGSDEDERQAAVNMSRSRGICIRAELEVDVVARRVKVVAGERAGDYLL